jgi:hypothetical protein
MSDEKKPPSAAPAALWISLGVVFLCVGIVFFTTMD